MSERDLIINGKTALGIELGSTRIKGVLIDFAGNVLAVGIHDWVDLCLFNFGFRRFTAEKLLTRPPAKPRKEKTNVY